MKSRFVLLSLATALAVVSGAALASGDHHHHKPTHGGVLVSGTHADFELVAKADVLQLYVSDHGKPIDLSKASAKLTFLSAAGTREVALTPAGDRLEASGSFDVAPGTKCVAVITDGGRTLGTARFTLK